MTEDVLRLLARLEGGITTEEMARMNYEVDVEGKNPKDVAVAFLTGKGLI